MKVKQKGMILITTLSMIIIITLLLLTQMQQIVLYAKAIGLQNESFKRMEQMEMVAKQLMNNPHLLDNWSCIIEKDEANGILKQVKKVGCKVEGNPNYQFLVEDLGIFDCIVIKQKNRLLSSHHYRVSLVDRSKLEALRYLQWRFIIPSKSNGHCNKPLMKITARLSGWRSGNI
jgi:hypothetical protein